MKKISKKLMIFLPFTLLGLGLALHLGEIDKIDNINPDRIQDQVIITTEVQQQEVENLTRINDDIKDRIAAINEQIDAFEDERAADNILLQQLRNQVENTRQQLGHRPLAGPGLTITLEGKNDDNIAHIVAQRRFLLNLVNELKAFGGEVISINGERITVRSDITLAGNHININSTAIAPPYIIDVIGNKTQLNRYIKYRTIIFDQMEEEGIESEIIFSEEVQVPAITRERPTQFLRFEEAE
ncbi:DUF881 domain-containing protein [Serpentinicella sp. ANB-PHB4]|uniref:DUF881 domain-containing protein n=1 Tax=Serpentinicella sp. ANB-PHB4 TaxID=3074076 RepID=UPI0028576602|nr:DUF881 domain-containing protein [Serpentinicella sp. ANB-PHB4]MDR5658706.1 DUF881 domain-containing protein [Serpentinicella sp. ANB-PHB4]